MFKRILLSLIIIVTVLGFFPPYSSPPVAAAGDSVFTSQLGFAPADPKVAILAVPSGASVSPDFRVLDSAGAVAYSNQPGDVQLFRGGWNGNNTVGDTYLLDFSRWTPAASGRFVMESNGVRSLPFEVGPAVYDVRRLNPLEFFRIQQSGVATSWSSLDGGPGGGHGPNHLDDARQASRRDSGGGDRRLIEQGTLSLPGGHVDVQGGWFDAGDYNMYMGNTPWAAYLLLRTYEDIGSYWSAVDNNVSGQPDLLEYVGPALEWMLKMQYSDGPVYERIFNGYGAAFDGRPDLETDNVSGDADDRPLDTDRYADITAKSSYAMATAYRVFGDQRFLNMAVKAWDWAYANQGTVKPKRYGGGLYFGDIEIGLTLGALELQRAIAKSGATPDAKYLQYATDRARAHLVAQDWVNPSSWDYQQSFAVIRYFDFGSDADKTTILNQLKGRWDTGARNQAANAYRMNDEWLYSDFGQNDLSASSAADALWVYSKTGDVKYYNYAVNQMAWVFGRNPFGESFLSSALVGEYTRIPHWRATAKRPIEGVVVPGATDRDGNHIPDYTDTGDYYYSEPTINQQAMFVYAMSMLNQAAGGATTPPPADLPPVISISSPAAGSTVSGSVTIAAAVSDDKGVDAVSYQIDGGAVTNMPVASGTSTSGTYAASWDTRAVADGTHTIMVAAIDSAGQRSSASISVNVRNGAAPSMHVERIDVALVQKGGNPKVQAKVDVFVYDAFGQPVAGSTVNGHWQGVATDSFSGASDQSGRVTDYSNSATSASGIAFTAVVDSVTKDGWLYDAAANKQTSASVTVP